MFPEGRLCLKDILRGNWWRTFDWAVYCCEVVCPVGCLMFSDSNYCRDGVPDTEPVVVILSSSASFLKQTKHSGYCFDTDIFFFTKAVQSKCW